MLTFCRRPKFEKKNPKILFSLYSSLPGSHIQKNPPHRLNVRQFQEVLEIWCGGVCTGRTGSETAKALEDHHIANSDFVFKIKKTVCWILGFRLF